MGTGSDPAHHGIGMDVTGQGKGSDPFLLLLAGKVEGKVGGAKGGKRAAANLTPEQRRERARRAALARWKKR